MKQQQNKLGVTTPREKKRRVLANSQFIRQKLEADYKPAYRNGFSGSRSPFSKKSNHRQVEEERRKTEQSIFESAKKQLRNGKNIMIDWSMDQSFRSTILPSINRKTSHESKSYLSKNTKKSRIENIKQREFHKYKAHFSGSSTKQISEKTDHLKQLLAQQEIFRALPKKKKNRKKKHKTTTHISLNSVDFEQNLPKSIKIKTQEHVEERSSVNSSAFTIQERLKMKEKLFFAAQDQRIKQAISQQKQIKDNPLSEFRILKSEEDDEEMPLGRENENKKKKKIGEIQQRIMSKSKLTLLKSELIKKFKEIRENILEEQESKNTRKSKLHKKI